MKKLLVLLCVAVGIMINGVDAKAFTTSPDAYPLVAGESYEWAVLEAEYRYAEAYKMIELVNKYRTDNGLTALQTNDALMKIAMQRALEVNIRMSHNAPYGTGKYPALTALGYNETYYGVTVYRFTEICTTAGTSSITALSAFQTSEGHNNSILQKANHADSSYYAIGVGIVDTCCVVCFFDSRYLPFSDYSNTTLKDYTSDEVVPFLTSVKSEEWFNNGAAAIYSTKEAAVAAAQDGSYKKHEDDCDCDDCLAEKDKEDSEDEEKENKTQKKIDTVKKTKISKPTVSKKRSGKNTKLTIKFNKTKKFSGAKYQIKVFKDKNCKKVLKSKNTKSSQWKVTINNKKYKKVYVKVRCYKTVDGEKIYGKWSKVKTVKIR